MADRKYTPRGGGRSSSAGQTAIQSPIMAEVPAGDTGTADSALAAQPVMAQLPPSVAMFAAAIGYVEALAASGDHELIMQLARIAYTRARQVERENGGDQ
jgi:hypothetical protein